MDSVFQELVNLIRIKNTELFKEEFLKLKDRNMTDPLGNNLLYYAQKHKAESIIKILRESGIQVRTGGSGVFVKNMIIGFIHTIQDWISRMRQNRKPVSLISVISAVLVLISLIYFTVSSFLSSPLLETRLTAVALVYQSLEQSQDKDQQIIYIKAYNQKDVFQIPVDTFQKLIKNGFTQEITMGTFLTAEIKSRYQPGLTDTNSTLIPIVSLKSDGRQWIKQDIFRIENIIRLAIFIPALALSIFIAVSRYRRFRNHE